MSQHWISRHLWSREIQKPKAETVLVDALYDLQINYVFTFIIFLLLSIDPYVLYLKEWEGEGK